MNLDNVATPQQVNTIANKQPEVLTTTQAAVIAQKNRRTIVDWIRNGYLPAYRMPGRRGHYRIRPQDLENVLQNPTQVKESDGSV